MGQKGQNQDYDNEVWDALHKAWKCYELPKTKIKTKKWSAMRILFDYQHDLGLEVSSFNIIAMSAATFFPTCTGI